MRILALSQVLNDPEYAYVWPSGTREPYPNRIKYAAVSSFGNHVVQIGFGRRETYERDRERVVIWIDNHPRAEFLGADDFEATGDVLCVIKVNNKECRYPDDVVPDRYDMFNVVGLPTRVSGKWVHSAWAVVANIADHRSMVSLAYLRMLDKSEQ